MRDRCRRCLTATPAALIGTCVGALARPNVNQHPADNSDTLHALGADDPRCPKMSGSLTCADVCAPAAWGR